MLSVLLLRGKHFKAQEKMCILELKGEDCEILACDNWNAGLKGAKGEYISFLEPEATLSYNYFHDLLDVFLEQPSFRKLAFVAPAVTKTSWFGNKSIYGYKIATSGVWPSFIKSSISPYSIQVGYLPGAVIRKSVMKSLEFFEVDPVMGSVGASLGFWQNGLRCLLDPRAIYTSPEKKLDTPITIENEVPKDIEKLIRMFKREVVG